MNVIKRSHHLPFAVFAELCDAVKKIQSTFRGKAFRKVAADADADADATVVAALDAAAGGDAKVPDDAAASLSDELADIDMADPDLAKAASKIQAKFRVKRK